MQEKKSGAKHITSNIDGEDAACAVCIYAPRWEGLSLGTRAGDVEGSGSTLKEQMPNLHAKMQNLKKILKKFDDYMLQMLEPASELFAQKILKDQEFFENSRLRLCDEYAARYARKSEAVSISTSTFTDEEGPLGPWTMEYINQGIKISNTDAITHLYEELYLEMRQAACKIIAKAFIKVVEPRKQTNYPYTGGTETIPPWWPAPRVTRHKEPDHLLKPQRVQLLIHILRIVQNPDCMSHVTIAIHTRKQRKTSYR